MKPMRWTNYYYSSTVSIYTDDTEVPRASEYSNFDVSMGRVDVLLFDTMANNPSLSKFCTYMKALQCCYCHMVRLVWIVGFWKLIIIMRTPLLLNVSFVIL